MMLNLNLSPEH